MSVQFDYLYTIVTGTLGSLLASLIDTKFNKFLGRIVVAGISGGFLALMIWSPVKETVKETLHVVEVPAIKISGTERLETHIPKIQLNVSLNHFDHTCLAQFTPLCDDIPLNPLQLRAGETDTFHCLRQTWTLSLLNINCAEQLIELTFDGKTIREDT